MSDDFFCACGASPFRWHTRCKQQCASCTTWSHSRPTTPVEVADAKVVPGQEPREPTPFETYGGLFLDFSDPRPEDVTIEDIARALSMTCRFAGHVSKFYSVAEHALVVSELVSKWGHPHLQLAALHHDSHEAYLGDWPTPLKRRVRASLLEELRQETDAAIGAAFGIDPSDFDHPIIKAADEHARFREAATLKASQGVGPHWGREEPLRPLLASGLAPRHVEVLFLSEHERLTT